MMVTAYVHLPERFAALVEEELADVEGGTVAVADLEGQLHAACARAIRRLTFDGVLTHVNV